MIDFLNQLKFRNEPLFYFGWVCLISAFHRNACPTIVAFAFVLYFTKHQTYCAGICSLWNTGSTFSHSSIQREAISHLFKTITL